MNDVGARLRLLLPPDARADWDDVVRRAGSSRRMPRLVVGVAVIVAAVLAVGSALALTGRLGNLLHGQPVRDLTPRERFILSELDVSGNVELIATKGSRTFYVIRRRGGQRCYALGEIRKGLTPAQAELNTRFSAVGCIDRPRKRDRLHDGRRRQRLQHRPQEHSRRPRHRRVRSRRQGDLGAMHGRRSGGARSADSAWRLREVQELAAAERPGTAPSCLRSASSNRPGRRSAWERRRGQHRRARIRGGG